MSFTANYTAIAKGMFRILEDMAEKGDESYLTALALGMLPAPLMQMAEDNFVEKLAQPAIDIGCSKKTAIKAIREHKIEVRAFNKNLAVALLAVAKANNNLVV